MRLLAVPVLTFVSSVCPVICQVDDLPGSHVVNIGDGQTDVDPEIIDHHIRDLLGAAVPGQFFSSMVGCADLFHAL